MRRRPLGFLSRASRKGSRVEWKKKGSAIFARRASPPPVGLERKALMHSPGRSVGSQLGASAADAASTHRREGGSGSVAAGALHSHRRRAHCSASSSAPSSSSSSSSSAPRQGARRGSGHLRNAIGELRNQKETEKTGVRVDTMRLSFFFLP